MKGKKAIVLGIEFGEKLMYKKERGPKLEKINARWEKGIFVGIRRKSNEVMIVTLEGVEEARSVSRLPEEHRWGGDNLNWVKWAPWRRYKDAVEADGDLPEGVPAEEREIEGPSQKGVVFVKTNRLVPRKFYISKKDAEKHGYTRGCGGCSSFTRGLGRQPH